MAITQSQADDLSNTQCQLTQLSNSIQSLLLLTNSIPNGRTSIQDKLRTIQFNLNAINQDVSRQLTSQKVR